jgi:hypothetical protein
MGKGSIARHPGVEKGSTGPISWFHHYLGHCDIQSAVLQQAFTEDSHLLLALLRGRLIGEQRKELQNEGLTRCQGIGSRGPLVPKTGPEVKQQLGQKAVRPEIMPNQSGDQGSEPVREKQPMVRAIAEEKAGRLVPA